MRSTGAPLIIEVAMTPAASAAWCSSPRMESSATSFWRPNQRSSAATASGDDEHAPRDVHLQGKAERDADEARLRDRLAEVGHALPDDEAAEGRGDGGEPEAGDERADEERLEHLFVSARRIFQAAPGAGWGTPARSWL